MARKASPELYYKLEYDRDELWPLFERQILT